MAKVGLNFGEKMQIVDKEYRVLNDGLVSDKEILGDLRFIEFVEMWLGREDDTSKPRRQDGTYPQKLTGEVFGCIVNVSSTALKKSIPITIVDMTELEFQELGLKHRDPIELKDIVYTYNSIGKRSDRIKLFASGIVKKSQNNPSNQPKQQDKPKENVK